MGIREEVSNKDFKYVSFFMVLILLFYIIISYDVTNKVLQYEVSKTLDKPSVSKEYRIRS